jgi:hypothetical protein
LHGPLHRVAGTETLPTSNPLPGESNQGWPGCCASRALLDRSNMNADAARFIQHRTTGQQLRPFQLHPISAGAYSRFPAVPGWVTSFGPDLSRGWTASQGTVTHARACMSPLTRALGGK